jgi:predicted RNA-binding protein
MATLIRNFGHEKEIKVESLLGMQEEVEGKIKFIQISYDKIVVVNEEQKPNKLKYNTKASYLCRENIYGNVIVCERFELY